MVLLILAGAWAAFLLPPYVRHRREARPGDSISSFRQQLSTLERATPGSRPVTAFPPRASAPGHRPDPSHGAPATRREGRRRRRDVLVTLVAAAALTLVLAVLLGAPALWLHLAIDAVLVGYVWLLVQLRKSAADRAAKVRYLPQRTQQDAALLLRRSASN
jgi:Flp pilus assembly protein TadB